MCEELKLIQTHLGIWKLEDWDVETSSIQLNGIYGIYCIKNIVTNKVLIGEGKLGGKGSRLRSHMIGNCLNTIWKTDLKKYSKENFRLIWIIPEEDEIQRKLIENKLQIYFKDNCYNIPRRKYPTQKELLENTVSIYNPYKTGNIIQRLNNYTINGDCWESNYKLRHGYGTISFNKKYYSHHVLMYILHYGDICGISSIVHHKCNNKRCVNPEHLELTTHTENIRLHHNSDEIKEKIQELSSQGLKIKEITHKLNLSRTTVQKYIGFKTTSKYRGVGFYNEKYEARIDKINLGYYKTEVQAAEHRDYYIVKNNLLSKRGATLNFHNIDYNNFAPYQQHSGKINKNLRS